MAVQKMILRGPRGWTTLTPSGDSRLIYVANAGNNANDGLTANTPKQTVAAGKALLRNGYPDWLQLKCGDTFDEALGSFEGISGRSITQRMVITSYGTGARPILRTGTSNCIETSNHNNQPNYIALRDLAMTAHTYDGSGTGPYGVFTLQTCNGWLIEGCEIYNYRFGIVMQDDGVSTTGAQIRRNVIHDIYNTVGGSNACSGMYLQGLISPLIEENIIDKASWASDANWSIYFHSMYVHNDVVTPIVRNNLFANGDGIQVRPGGNCTGNVGSRVRVGIEYGLGTFPAVQGITGNCDDNCILQSHSPGIANGDSQAHYTGMRAGNMAGGTIRRNIFANAMDTADPAEATVLSFESANTDSTDRAMQNVTISDIIACDFGGDGIETHISRAGTFSGNAITRLVIQNPNKTVCNGYYAPGANFNAYLIAFFQGTPTSAEFTWDHCHLSRNATLVANHDAGQHHEVLYNGINIFSFTTFYTQVSATNSDSTVQTYPHNTLATLGEYYKYLGYSDQGSDAANHAAFMTLAKGQRKTNWDPRFTAQNIRTYVVNYCFGSPW